MHAFERLMQNIHVTSLSDQSREAWFEVRAAACQEFVSHLQTIESWHEGTYRLGKLRAIAEGRLQRAQFYQEKAMQMDPPMEPQTLAGCLSYQRALRYSRYSATQRSWSELKPKIEEERKLGVVHVGGGNGLI